MVQQRNYRPSWMDSWQSFLCRFSRPLKHELFLVVKSMSSYSSFCMFLPFEKAILMDFNRGHVFGTRRKTEFLPRYARLLWEFWKRDSELFPPEAWGPGCWPFFPFSLYQVLEKTRDDSRHVGPANLWNYGQVSWARCSANNTRDPGTSDLKRRPWPSHNKTRPTKPPAGLADPGQSQGPS